MMKTMFGLPSGFGCSTAFSAPVDQGEQRTTTIRVVNECSNTTRKLWGIRNKHWESRGLIRTSDVEGSKTNRKDEFNGNQSRNIGFYLQAVNKSVFRKNGWGWE